MNWINHWRSQRFPNTHINDVTLETVMIAVQGPNAAQVMDNLCDSEPSGMRFFSSMETRINGLKSFLGRTGYTGEDGFEVIVDATDGSHIWQTLISNGMSPCGLGSRDVLRLEAGLALHGSDIDLTTSPLEAGLDRFVQLEKEFAGAPVLRKQQNDGINRKLIGLTVKGRNIPRHNYPIIHNNSEVGHVTSGTMIPYWRFEDANPSEESGRRAIGLAYLRADLAAGQPLEIGDGRRTVEAVIVKRHLDAAKAPFARAEIH